jgi:hypothetical protein
MDTLNAHIKCLHTLDIHISPLYNFLIACIRIYMRCYIDKIDNVSKIMFPQILTICELKKKQI